MTFVRSVAVLSLMVAAMLSSARADEPSTAPATQPVSLDDVLARIHAPQFPARDFAIIDYGASPDADCTDAIRRAIAACHDAGGGHVVVPAGVFLTGPVRLLSNVDLHLADGATLRFDPDPKRYLPPVLTRFEGVECMNYSPLIYALDQENVAVTGRGTLDGSATVDNWLGWNTKQAKGERSPQTAARQRLVQMGETGVAVEQRVFGEGSFLRPNFIQIYRSRNVLVEGVTIVRSPMWEVHPVLCENVTVRGVTVDSLGPNNDGCDPESCRDVLIEDCTFATGDDCIAIKSGRNNDGRRVGAAAENIVVRRCTMKDGHGGVTIGSEISGGCRNVFVEACKMDSPHLNQAIRFKSNAQRGGTIEHVRVRDVEIGRVAVAALSVEFTYEEGAAGPYQPVLRDVLLERVTTQSCGQAVRILGLPAATIEGIVLRDCTFGGVESPDRIVDAAPPTMENVTVERKGR